MKLKIPKETLFNSAMLIAIATGLCYGLGFLAQSGRGKQLGIPWQFLPNMTFHQLLAVGAIYLVIYLALGLFFYFLWLYLEGRIKWHERIRNYFRVRYSEHRIAFMIFLFLIGSTILIIFPIYIQGKLIGRLILQSENIPNVYSLKIKNQCDTITNEDSWQYICSKNGIVLLYRKLDKIKYVRLIREEDIDILILEIPSK